jgi:hypothetical protein
MIKYEYYKRIIDPAVLLQNAKLDSELGLRYVEDSLCIGQNDPSVLRKTNIAFLKILKRNHAFEITSRVFTFYHFTQEKFSAIINDIEASYLDDTFCDSDLHDDVFNYFQIVSPLLAYSHELSQHFTELNFPKFQNMTLPESDRETNARKSCKAFLKDRSKLFCTYIFLRRCAILYRDSTFKRPLEELLIFLSNTANLDYLKEKLRAAPFLYRGDWWATGLHEWLERSQTVLALKRTAGYCDPNKKTDKETHIPGVEVTIRFGDNAPSTTIFSEFNWLDIQFLIRTETKHVIFPHNLHGHVGAVYSGLKHNQSGNLEVNKSNGGYKGEGQQTVWKMANPGNPFFKIGFNAHVENLFNDSNTLFDFMYSLRSFYENYILHDGTVNYVLTKPIFLCDGPKSTTAEVGLFSQKKLRKTHKMINIWFRDSMIQSYIVHSLGHNGELRFTYLNDFFPQYPPDMRQDTEADCTSNTLPLMRP